MSARGLAKSQANAKALLVHDYAKLEEMETQQVSKKCLSSPSKPLAPPKKLKANPSNEDSAENPDTSNAAILAAIGKLNDMMETFGIQQKQNSLMIANNAKSV